MATQGRGREAFNHWVKEYYVSYREGESGLWIPFIKSGETRSLVRKSYDIDFIELLRNFFHLLIFV